MNITLPGFQDALVQALMVDPDGGSAVHPMASQPGFAVYRNTVMKACIDALQANFPAVVRLVGEEWFRAAAAVFVQEELPSDARLLLYGKNFPAFLRDFVPAKELPYLWAVALTDRHWTEAHVAPDAAVLSASSLVGVPLERLVTLVLLPHPTARWAWHEVGPVHTIWQGNRDMAAAEPDGELVWNPEGVLITRPDGAVQSMAIDAAACGFLDACQAGLPLSDAAAVALSCNAKADLAALMAALLEAGAFSAP